jgi:hypothetical protein
VRRKLLLLNAALAAAAVMLGVKVHQEIAEGRRREQMLDTSRPKPAPLPKLAPQPQVPPVSPAQYSDVAQKMLFSPDRNPTVVLPPPKIVEKPVPPFPVAHGVMIFGSVPPTVILSLPNNKEQGSYQAGDSIGEFKIVSINNTDVVFEWDGKRFDKTLAELVDTSAPVQDAQSAPAASSPVVTNAAPAQPEVKNTSSANANGPGRDLGAGFYACQEGDSSPEGTVQDGKRKVTSNNPFSPGGKSCYWEVAK